MNVTLLFGSLNIFALSFSMLVKKSISSFGWEEVVVVAAVLDPLLGPEPFI
jgi:hypothetical protein